MVMGVCRGVLDDTNDADDAFQATFLLLARKAGVIWVNDSLGGWLHRVACRIAILGQIQHAKGATGNGVPRRCRCARTHDRPVWDDATR